MGSTYHKITITTEERRVSQVTVRCLHQDAPLIIYLGREHCGGHGRAPGWDAKRSPPHGVTQQAARGRHTWPTPSPLLAPTAATTVCPHLSTHTHLFVFDRCSVNLSTVYRYVCIATGLCQVYVYDII